jgi:hypothetical protein
MCCPWEAIHAAMQEELADLSWTELFFGTAFLAAGSRGPEPSVDERGGAAISDRGRRHPNSGVPRSK